MFGESHIHEMAECMKKVRNSCDMIAGFDMVNEEDATQPLLDLVKALKTAQKTLKNDCDFFFHGKRRVMAVSGREQQKEK